MSYTTLDNLNKGKKLEGVQLLRGAAALGVVLTHVVTRSILYHPDAFRDSFFRLKDGDQWKGGDIGVDIFFVISGFIIMIVHRGDLGKPKSYMNFLARRLQRVLPLYWTLTTAAVALFIFLPQLTANSKSGISIFWVVCSYLFIPTSLSGLNNSPVVGVGWTLDYEMFFYFVFAMFMSLNMEMFVVAITSIFSILVLGGEIIQPSNLYGKFVSDWLLMDFVGGVWIAYFMLKNNKLSTRSAVLISLCSLTVILSTFGFSVPEIGPMRLVLWGLPSIFLVKGLVQLRMQDSPLRSIILIVGDASYSIYLSQVFTIPLWASIISKLRLSNYIDVQIALTFLLTSASGVTVWYFVEKKMNKIIHNVFGLARERVLR